MDVWECMTTPSPSPTSTSLTPHTTHHGTDISLLVGEREEHAEVRGTGGCIYLQSYGHLLSVGHVPAITISPCRTRSSVSRERLAHSSRWPCGSCSEGPHHTYHHQWGPTPTTPRPQPVNTGPLATTLTHLVWGGGCGGPGVLQDG